MPGMTRSAAPILLALVLAGCSAPAEPVAPSPSSAPPAAAAASLSARDYGPFVTAVRFRFPGLAAGMTDRAIISSARNVCLDLAQGKPADTVARNTAARYDASPAQAAEVVALAVDLAC